MSKSKKRKSRKGFNTGTMLGALALIIAIGALGLSLYQFIPPTGPTIYSASNNDLVPLDGISGVEYLPELNLTYSAKAGDSVLIEFSCIIYLDPTTLIHLYVNFDINGTVPLSNIHVSSESAIFTNGYVRYYIESSQAGEFNVQPYAYITEDYTNSFVRYSLLTVTVD
ncbi:MAG: hypothetical protein ACTSSE_16970 [Candidatus Thorarchaeota archaeon]